MSADIYDLEQDDVLSILRKQGMPERGAVELHRAMRALEMAHRAEFGPDYCLTWEVYWTPYGSERKWTAWTRMNLTEVTLEYPRS